MIHKVTINNISPVSPWRVSYATYRIRAYCFYFKFIKFIPARETHHRLVASGAYEFKQFN